MLLLLFAHPALLLREARTIDADPAERDRRAAELAAAPRWFWDPEVVTSGVHTYAHRYVQAEDGASGAVLQKAIDDYTLRYYEEGLNAVVTVNSVRNFPESLTLQVNGKTDASNADDFPTEVVCASLPLLMHPDPEQVLVIGLGSGISAGTVTRFREVDHFDVIEIEQAVVNAARFFRADNYDILPDPARGHPGHPKMTLHVEDARHFCAVTPNRYDVVISEPSNPWMSGPSHLFTQEHFRNLRRVMKDDGLTLQWVQTYSMTPELVYSVVLTFRSVFDHVLLLGYPRHPSDFFLLGANRPVTIDAARLRERFARPEVRRDLERVGFQTDGQLLAALILRQEDLDRNLLTGPPGRPDIATLLQSVPLNRDDFPYVEFEAPRHLHAIDSGRAILHALLRFRDNPWPPVEPFNDETLRALDLPPRLADANAKHGFKGAALKILERGLQADPADDETRFVIATTLFEMWKETPEDRRDPATVEGARSHFADLLARHPRNSMILSTLGEIAMVERQHARAVELYEAAVAAGSGVPAVHNNLGYAYVLTGREDDAEKAFKKSVALDPAYLPAIKNLADHYGRTKQYDREIEVLTRWYGIEIHPVNRSFVRRRLEETRRRKDEAAGEGGR
jgi:spermidine synthase/tetratricopeptide (TPR) repeat protein